MLSRTNKKTKTPVFRPARELFSGEGQHANQVGISRRFASQIRGISSKQVCLILLLLVCCVAGCERVDSQFVQGTEIQQLHPDGQAVIHKNLLEAFGTPLDPKIPAYFPIDRGGVRAVIGSVDESQLRQLTLEPIQVEEVGTLNLAANVPVELVLDPEAVLEAKLAAVEEEQPDPFEGLHALKISSYDLTKHLLTLNQDFPKSNLIEPGTEVVLNANSKLKEASVLYAHHCLHCHGVSGDGNGPTAPFMNPRPRDYRLGIFKFTSTAPQEKISSADLKLILKEGIPGTYMPAFNMLTEEQLDLLVTYVRYLAIRGEAERRLAVEVGVDFSNKALEEGLEGVEDSAEREETIKNFREELTAFLKADYAAIELETLMNLAESWTTADEPDSVLYSSIPRPDPRGPSLANPELSSIENGRLLYLGKDAQCASCHGDTGRGNGYQTFQFQRKADGGLYDVVGLHDEWGNPLPPRDLTIPIYRGGRRPVDMFRRIYAGIKGTPMPAFGGKGLTDEQIWDIVNYVLVMPEEAK